MLPPASCLLEEVKLQYTPVFGLLQPVPGDFWSNDVSSGSLPVTWGHVTSFPVMWLPPPTSCSLLGSEMYSICQYSAFYGHFQVTSGEWRHFLGSSGHLKSHDVISRHVTASPCQLQPCRQWNVRYTPAFGLLQSIPGDFLSNDVTSGSLTVTSGHVMSIPVT